MPNKRSDRYDLYIYNYPSTVTSSMIRRLLHDNGYETSSIVPISATKSSITYYGVVLLDKRKIRNAITHLNNTNFHNKKLYVSDQPHVGSNLYIPSLPSGFDNEDLDNVASELGELHSAKVCPGNRGYVQFVSAITASEAILSGLTTEYNDETISLTFDVFIPKDNRKPLSASIKLDNLDSSVTEDDIRRACSHYGNVKSVHLKPQGYAYVNFQETVNGRTVPSPDSARKAVVHLNGTRELQTRSSSGVFAKIQAPRQRPIVEESEQVLSEEEEVPAFLKVLNLPASFRQSDIVTALVSALNVDPFAITFQAGKRCLSISFSSRSEAELSRSKLEIVMPAVLGPHFYCRITED
ncbi:hypothetical protein RCL1_006686 [Eukaryota sp. TZLM3-RCL]